MKKRFSLRSITFLWLALSSPASLTWHAPPAQAQTSASESLLGAYYELWHQLNRQPAPEEIDSRSPYRSSEYLDQWQNWENVRRALIDYLYRNAMSAALRQDVQTAADFYGKCLEIDPEHPQARAAYQIDLDEAAGLGDEFSTEKAGSTARSFYVTFLASHEDGDE